MEENGDSGSFLFFLLIMAVYLVLFLRKRAKKKKEQETSKRVPQNAPPPPSLPKLPVKILSESPTTKPPIPHAKKKPKPRIVKLVQGLKSKKKLILFSEILSINPYIK